MHKNCLVIITILLFFTVQSQPIQKLRIDPAQAYGGTVSEYFSEVEYISPQSTREVCLIQLFNSSFSDSGFEDEAERVNY